MAAPSWDRLERPILEAVAELEDIRDPLGLEPVSEQTGLPIEQVRVGVRRLLDTNLLTGREVATFDEYDAMGLRLLPKGRQLVRQWPPDETFESFYQLLAERIENEKDPETRSRLERFRDAAGGVGKDVLTATLTALVQRMAGLG